MEPVALVSVMPVLRSDESYVKYVWGVPFAPKPRRVYCHDLSVLFGQLPVTYTEHRKRNCEKSEWIAKAEMRPRRCTWLWFSVAKMIVKWGIHIAASC